MSTIAYQCPCCGAPLAYGAESGKLECAACGNSYETEAIEAMNPAVTDEGPSFDLPKDTFNQEDAAGMQATAEFSKFAGILRAALSQHHLFRI